ncbi:MAG: AAA family ATPase [Thomasclavelia sp.]
MKKIPIGITNYRKLREDNYYNIDKSLMIEEFLSTGRQVTLITRPRRFGKTLNMSMMAEFFDVTKDSKELFKDTKIMKTEYCSYLNQYPTLFVSFANAKGDKETIVEIIKQSILALYFENEQIFSNMNKFEKLMYDGIIDHLSQFYNGSLSGIANSLSFLMTMLEKYYGKRVMVFIDEYDTPFIEGHVGKFYDEIRSGLASILHNALKTSDSIEYAMLTGIQRVAKENIFSDLNNPVVCTVNDKRYSQYFGFNEDEVKELLSYYGLELNEQVKEMYDGYHIGDNEIYNPWSLINYADAKKLRPYWVNTSANNMIRYALEKAKHDFFNEYEELIEKGYLDTWVVLETSFYEVSTTPCLWGLFINAGYLTIVETMDESNGYYKIKVPNKEVQNEFKSLTSYYLKISETELSKMFQGLIYQKADMFIETYQNILLTMPSYHDLISENSYHMMMLGMSAWLSNDYEIISNKEAGIGRCDIILKAKKDNLASYIIEFKYSNNEKEDLDKLANQAIKQIKDNKYDIEIEGKVIYIGLGHYHKQVKMKWREKLS